MTRRGGDPAAALVVNGLAVAALAGVIGWPNTAPRVGWALALAAGVVVGYALFAGLTGSPRLMTGRRPLIPLAITAALLVLGATVEEIVWRGYALGAAAPELGIVAAFVASTVGFALLHLEPRAIAAHLLTGASFGGLFLATDTLAAPIAAHATYNLAILFALASRRVPRPALASLPTRIPAATTAVIEARQVEKRYRSINALRGFDLRVAAGEVVALLGPNGSGKTTAIHVLLGLRKPDAGWVRVLGHEPGDIKARRRLGVTLQEMGCPPTLRVGEVVSFAAAHFSVDVPAARLLAPYHLDQLERRQIGGLSGGERRRLAVALAFAGQPELVFLDEPTTGLDVESRRQVWAGIRSFAAARGTVLLTTHSLEEAEVLASRVAVMRAGRVIKTGSARAIKHDLGTETLEEAFVALTETDR